MRFRASQFLLYLLLVLLIFVIGFFYPDEITRLTLRGFYVYVLPESYTDAGWQREVRMHSYKYHCSGDSQPRWNPISIDYRNAEAHRFVIRIAPTNPIWDPRRETAPISLPVEWIPSQEGAIYGTEEGGYGIRIEDRFGMIAVIYTGGLNIEYLQEAISRLEYRGPDISTVGNPWEDICR